MPTCGAPGVVFCRMPSILDKESPTRLMDINAKAGRYSDGHATPAERVANTPNTPLPPMDSVCLQPGLHSHPPAPYPFL